MKRTHLMTAVAAVLALTACGKGGDADTNAPITAEPVAPPAGGDWSKTVVATPEGGFQMGNPDAAVKLIEYGSMTCPHCAEFEEEGMPALVENYVKKGLVSFEFRNFVRDRVDLAASLLARCGGKDRFFPLTKAIFADQKTWFQRVIDNPQAEQAASSLPPSQIFVELAKVAGLQEWAAQRGLPSAQANACLANENEQNRLVQLQTDAVATYNVPGTPAFVINGKLVEGSNWQLLEPKIREALR